MAVPGSSTSSSPPVVATPPSPAGPLGLQIEAPSPRVPSGSPQLQSLSLDVGTPHSGPRGKTSEEGWKGEILPDFLYLGDRVTASDRDRLRALKITHVLNATEDVSNFFEAETASLQYMRCSIVDQSSAAREMHGQIDGCCAFLDACRSSGGRALVHCRAGVSRSATIVIAYLMHSQRWELKAALAHVSARRFVQPNTGFLHFLIEFELRTRGCAPSLPRAAGSHI